MEDKEKSLRKVSNIYLVISFTGVFLAFLYFLFPALVAGSRHSFALFMDERITYEPVHKALEGGWIDKLAFFFDGHDNRYGRILWNLDFIASYIPYQVYGDQGQIIATRLTQVIVLVAGYILLIFSMIRSNGLRALCFISLLFLPPSLYYSLMPKPEPQIVLALGTIMYCLKSGRSKWFFFLLGILGGLKISMIPTCLILAVFYFLYYNERFSIKDIWVDTKKILWKTLLVFICLSAVLSLLFHTYFMHTYAEEYAKLTRKQLYAIFVCFNAVSAAFFIMVTGLWLSKAFRGISSSGQKIVRLLAGLAVCNTYLYFTPFNFLLYLTTPVSHGADSSSVNVIDWLQFINEIVFFDNLWLTILFVSGMIGIIIYLEWKQSVKVISDRRSILLLFFILALMNLLPVLLTKRLWSFYLLIPMMFLFVFITALADKTTRIGVKGFVVILFIVYPAIAWPAFISEIHAKEAVEEEENFQVRKKEYVRICSEINRLAEGFTPEERTAFWDPNLFFPDQVHHMDIKIFWGPFLGWKDGRKLVVLSNYPEKLYGTGRSNKNQDKEKESILQFHNFTDPDSGTYMEYKKDSFVYHKIFIKR